jgi:hypothetical protein
MTTGREKGSGSGGFIVIVAIVLAILGGAFGESSGDKAGHSAPAADQTAGFSLGGTDEDCSGMTGDEYDTCYAANVANDTTCDNVDGEVVCSDANGNEIRP